MIAGAVIGLIGSFIPEVIKIFKNKADHKREMEMLEMQLKYQKEMAEMRVAEATATAQLDLDKEAYQFTAITEIKPTGKTWLDAIQVIMNAFNQSVRPTITYIIVLAWLALKFAMWQQAGGTLDAIPKVWSDYENEFVSIIVTFWFGGRSMIRIMGKK